MAKVGKELMTSGASASLPVTNAQGKPIAFVLTPGNVADISAAATLLDEIAPPHRTPPP